MSSFSKLITEKSLSVGVSVGASAAQWTPIDIFSVEWHRLYKWNHDIGSLDVGAPVDSLTIEMWQFFSVCTEIAHPYGEYHLQFVVHPMILSVSYLNR
jgi:hypothetical protein